MLILLGMAEWCIPFWVTFTFSLTSGLISRFFVSGAYLLCHSLLSSNVPYDRPIPLEAFVTCLLHFLFCINFGQLIRSLHMKLEFNWPNGF